ncbi:MAG: branched-chain amino acid ABC transporter permease [Chitinivibrionales bacterium]|nr:branched-chain amino acid ABC transporter permease [Chitinivibrionales bacterium]
MSSLRWFKSPFVILAVFILVQTAAGLLSSVREGQYYSRILFMIEINLIATMSLSLINGFTGQFSLGHAGFMAIGAYVSAAVTTLLPRLFIGAALSPATLGGQAFFLAALLSGGGCAAVAGFCIGFPSLRLRGDYLAIVTLAAGEVVRAIFRFLDFFGGPRGVPGVPQFTNALYLGCALVASVFLMRNYVWSHFGRACIAVRENEIAAGCMGINTTRQKVSVFMIGAFFAGISGGLFAHLSQYINPDNFSILKSLDLLIFLYVGGAQSLSGALTGAALFTAVPEGLRLLAVENWRMVLYPLLLIAIMRFKRDGIVGNREFAFLAPRNILPLRPGRAQKPEAAAE